MIRNAISITEKLGVRNIWIDALCIIQDDSMDKHIEIEMMPFIYS